MIREGGGVKGEATGGWKGGCREAVKVNAPRADL